jgi:hypothetical protein
MSEGDEYQSKYCEKEIRCMEEQLERKRKIIEK